MSQHRDELRALRERYRAIADVDRDALPSLWAAVFLRMRDDGMIRGHGSVPGELAESLVAPRDYRVSDSLIYLSVPGIMTWLMIGGAARLLITLPLWALGVID